MVENVKLSVVVGAGRERERERERESWKKQKKYARNMKYNVFLYKYIYNNNNLSSKHYTRSTSAYVVVRSRSVEKWVLFLSLFLSLSLLYNTVVNRSDCDIDILFASQASTIWTVLLAKKTLIRCTSSSKTHGKHTRSTITNFT